MTTTSPTSSESSEGLLLVSGNAAVIWTEVTWRPAVWIATDATSATVTTATSHRPKPIVTDLRTRKAPSCHRLVRTDRTSAKIPFQGFCTPKQTPGPDITIQSAG